MSIGQIVLEPLFTKFLRYGKNTFIQITGFMKHFFLVGFRGEMERINEPVTGTWVGEKTTLEVRTELWVEAVERYEENKVKFCEARFSKMRHT